MDVRESSHQRADGDLLSLLECLAEYQATRESSGALLRQGFFDLALARRSTGYQSISPDWCHGSARASASVALDEHPGDLRLVVGDAGRAPRAKDSETEHGSHGSPGDSGGVRQRRRQSANGHRSQDDGDATAATGDGDKSAGGADPDDPLLWFGVLVPPALRDAQGRFKEALGELIRLAQLKGRLERRLAAARQAIDDAGEQAVPGTRPGARPAGPPAQP
ncbi:hypothetical protein LPJ61_001620 [Coemansia biformis]|uniref:Vacuolar ATPase assembly protein VMA22 n=1 Tax=Coemansia biformis TaxID=1286918 RepID=A0A9W8D0F7_9FUNG|nr:hypothetical protein LPJ61_001620 [Coemansia biformis]